MENIGGAAKPFAIAELTKNGNPNLPRIWDLAEMGRSVPRPYMNFARR
jgi:hypothetical protein